jgi:hypothetical protein
MKKLLLNFWNFCRSIFLQILLLAVAYECWLEAKKLANPIQSLLELKAFLSRNGGIVKRDNLADIYSSIYSEPDGGALVMGLIACVCIYCIVWLQINKTKP